VPNLEGMDIFDAISSPAESSLDVQAIPGTPFHSEASAPAPSEERNTEMDTKPESNNTEDITSGRIAPRHDLRVEVSGQSDHQFFTGFSENISTGGLFIATYQTLPLGTTFQFSFSVPGVDRQFDCKCEVRWVREHDAESPHGVPGVGVNFLELSPADERILDAILSRVDTMFYDD